MLLKLLFIAVVCVTTAASMANGSIFGDLDDIKQAPLVPAGPSENRDARPSPDAHPSNPPVAPEPPSNAAPSRWISPAPSVAESTRTESIKELAARTRESVVQARALLHQYLERADAEVQASLNDNQDYLRAMQRANRAKDKLDYARRYGTSEEKLAASSEYNIAAAQAKTASDAAYAKNADYADAKSLEQASSAAKPAMQDDSQKAIASAIARRDLIEGMTYQQACQAARSRGRLDSSNKNTTVYRWDVYARTGSHKVITESHSSIIGGSSRDEYREVPDYRLVAYILATFVDSKLVSFKRVDPSNPSRESPAQSS